MILHVKFVATKGKAPNGISAREQIERYLVDGHSSIIAFEENSTEFVGIIRTEAVEGDAVAERRAGIQRDRLLSGAYYARVFDSYDEAKEAVYP